MTLEDGKRLKIFTGNANPALAKEICDYLDLPIGEAFVGRFNNGEVQVMIDESVRGKDVFIVQPTSYPVNDNVVELFIMADALKRASARHITAVVPYYGYARQDRKTRGREPITAKLMADLLQTAGVTRLVTVDLHAGQIQGFFVSPDLGGVTRARDLADRIGAPIAIIEKKRPQPGVAKVMNLIGDVQGKNCIIIDDIVDTAGSLVEGAKALQEFGAKSVTACVTHAVLTDPACERIANSNIKELIVTNTIDIPEERRLPNITVLSVAPLLGDAILRIFREESVSSLFDK